VVAGLFSSIPFAQAVSSQPSNVRADNSSAVSAASKPAVDSVDIAKKLAHPIANMNSVVVLAEIKEGLSRPSCSNQ